MSPTPEQAAATGNAIRYPEEERGSVQTTVLVLACVAPPHDVAFEREAIDAVRRAKFKAGTKDGEPVALWTVVPVEFHPG